MSDVPRGILFFWMIERLKFGGWRMYIREDWKIERLKIEMQCQSFEDWKIEDWQIETMKDWKIKELKAKPDFEMVNGSGFHHGAPMKGERRQTDIIFMKPVGFEDTSKARERGNNIEWEGAMHVFLLPYESLVTHSHKQYTHLRVRGHVERVRRTQWPPSLQPQAEIGSTCDVHSRDPSYHAKR